MNLSRFFTILVVISAFVITSTFSDARDINSLNEGRQLLFKRGDYNGAILKLSKARNYYRESNDIIGELETIRNLLIAYMKSGKYSKALNLLVELEDMEIYQNVTPEVAVAAAKAIQVACPLYFQIRDVSKSKKYALKVLDIGKKYDNDYLVASGYNHLAKVNIFYHPSEAIKYCNMALKIKKVPDGLKAYAYYHLGDSYSTLEEYNKAIEAFTTALKIYKKKGPTMVAWCYEGIGWALYKQGKYKKAINTFNKALKTKVTPPEAASRLIICMLALTYDSSNDVENALEYYFQAIDRIEKAKDRLESDDQKIGFMATSGYRVDNFTFYQNFIRFLTENEAVIVSLNKKELFNYGKNIREITFHFNERIKSRQFMEQIAQSKLRFETIENTIPKETLNHEKELVDRYAITIKDHDYLVKSGDRSSKIKKSNQTLEKIKKELDSFIVELRSQYPLYASVKHPEVVKVSQIKLNEGEKIFEYGVIEDRTYLWVIGKSGVENLIEIPIGGDDLKKLILKYREPFEELSKINDFDSQLSNKLYKLLLHPALKDIHNCKHLYIIPDGPLYLLSFCSLMTDIKNLKKEIDSKIGVSTYKDVQYLIDSYTVSYYPSASIYMVNENIERVKKQKAQSLFAMGDPIYTKIDNRSQNVSLKSNNQKDSVLRSSLEQVVNINRLPNTGVEVKRISKLFDDKNTLIKLGAKASESDLKNTNLESYKYVHFATHGIISSDTEKISEPALILALYNDPSEDGLLTMSEIYDIKLDADLVVLSACETGLGKMIRGEGIIGLSRAFMFAGTPSVLVTIWKIEDEATAILMEDLYKQLIQQNYDKATALVVAQKNLRDLRYSHPYFWSAFKLIGKR